MYFSVRSGLEWWVSAAIILAYVGLTVYYRTDPDEPGFIFLLVISVVTYVVCLALGQFWPRLPFAPHRFFWNDSSFPHRRERLAKLAHLYLGRINLWIVAMLGFGIVAVSQLFVARPYEWLIWIDVCFGMCVILYAVCLYLDARAFSLALRPERARMVERKNGRETDGAAGEGEDDDEEELGERKKLLPGSPDSHADATPLKRYAATDVTSRLSLEVTQTPSESSMPTPPPTSPPANSFSPDSKEASIAQAERAS